MSTHATLEAYPLEVVPGGETICRLTLRNNSDVVEAYGLEVVGDAAGWAAVEPPAVSLYPMAEATVTIAFRPPRSARVAAGQMPFAVRVQPSERPGDAVAAEGSVTVLPFTETTAEIVPRTSKGRSRARHEVAIDNRGNVPITAGVVGMDPDGLLTVSPRPATLTVPPGQAAFATVSVRNRRRLWRGQPITHPFQVVVAPQGPIEPQDPPIVLDAGTLQTPVFPRATTRVLAAVAALLVLAAAAWFLLLKPAVKSAAKDAVAQPLANVAEKADKADQKAASAGEKADTAVAVAGGATPAPATSSTVTATVTAPATVRLQTFIGPSTTPAVATHTVPAKNTLVITDIVLENPQGDTGRIDVLVDNNPILILALANFRDLDYHFVSAIEVPAGKTLSIRTTCQTPGPPLAGFAAGQCRVWVLAGGTNRVSST